MKRTGVTTERSSHRALIPPGFCQPATAPHPKTRKRMVHRSVGVASPSRRRRPSKGRAPQIPAAYYSYRPRVILRGHVWSRQVVVFPNERRARRWPAGRKMPRIDGRHVVPDGEFLPVGIASERSFDGRYWGHIPRERAIPLRLKNALRSHRPRLTFLQPEGAGVCSRWLCTQAGEIWPGVVMLWFGGPGQQANQTLGG